MRFSSLLLFPFLVLTCSNQAHAQSCPPGGCPGGPFIDLATGPGLWHGGPDAWDPVTHFPDAVRIFPYGGYTAYVPRGIDCHGDFSPYHQIYYLAPPAATAQCALKRLTALGIPLVPCEPEFLGRNPHTDRYALPAPRKPEEKTEEEKKADEDKKKEEAKPEDPNKKLEADKAENKEKKNEVKSDTKKETPVSGKLGEPKEMDKSVQPTQSGLPASRLPDPNETEKKSQIAAPRP
jgi:hypothetical protein